MVQSSRGPHRNVLRYIPPRATPAADVRCNLLIFRSYSRLQDTAARLSSFKASSSSSTSSSKYKQRLLVGSESSSVTCFVHHVANHIIHPTDERRMETGAGVTMATAIGSGLREVR